MLAVFAALAACEAGKPVDDSAPGTASPENTRVKQSTSSAASEVLNAPGNYLKSTVGQIDKAKAAKKLFEETEAERMKQLPEGE